MIVSVTVQNKPKQRTNVRYWPKCWLVWQPGNLVWSWRGSCLFLWTARTPLCTSTDKEAQACSISSLIHIDKKQSLIFLSFILTSLMVCSACDMVTIFWLVTTPEYHVCCWENSDWDWKACLNNEDTLVHFPPFTKHVQLHCLCLLEFVKEHQY